MAWSDSMIHDWNQISFRDLENEVEEELTHEISQQLFHERDLNRRLDHDALNHVNRYFERVSDLAGQQLSYRQAEKIAVNVQCDVISILRNIIACQQQHTEALRHAAEFWRSCHEQLHNEFTQIRQIMVGVPVYIHQQRTEQRLSLMSECLNLLQRMMAELYYHIVRRS